VLLTAGLLALIYGLDAAISHRWRSSVVIAGLIAAAVFLAAFTVAERRAEAPLVPFSVFSSKTLRYANIATLFLLGTVVTIFFFASLFMQQVLGYSPLRTGLAYVPLAVVVAVGAGIASNAAGRAPAKTLHPQCVFVDEPLGLRLEGRDGARRHYEMWWARPWRPSPAGWPVSGRCWERS